MAMAVDVDFQVQWRRTVHVCGSPGRRMRIDRLVAALTAKRDWSPTDFLKFQWATSRRIEAMKERASAKIARQSLSNAATVAKVLA